MKKKVSCFVSNLEHIPVPLDEVVRSTLDIEYEVCELEFKSGKTLLLYIDDLGEDGKGSLYSKHKGIDINEKAFADVRAQIVKRVGRSTNLGKLNEVLIWASKELKTIFKNAELKEQERLGNSTKNFHKRLKDALGQND